TLRNDEPPTVVIAQPSSPTLLEGRDFALVVAAQDDVSVSSVDVTVVGGLNGPMRFAGTSPPYSFRVPLPYGSAGRTLPIQARAPDSKGHVANAETVSVEVVKDPVPPTVSFLRPADGSQITEGLTLEVEAVADDNVAVSSVQFKLGEPLLATMPSPPFRLY